MSLDQTNRSDLLTAADEILQTDIDALETDRHQVARLERNRAWLSLRGHLLERRERLRQDVMRNVLGPTAKKAPADQRMIDHARGVIETIDWVLALPGRMQEELNRAK